MGKNVVGSSILEKKGYTLLPPTEQKKLEQFQKQRRLSKDEQEGKELTSTMPTEPEPSNDQLSCDRAKLFEEKNVAKQSFKIKDPEQ